MGALLVVVPLLAVVLLNLPLGKTWRKLAMSLAALLCVAEAVAAIGVALPFWAERSRLTLVLRTELPVDGLAQVMFLCIALVSLSAIWVARYAMSGDGERQFRFANLVLLAIAGMNGIVLVRDLFALYVFLEITAVASFVLIALEGGRAAFEGAFKYMILSAVATALLLAGLALLFSLGGSTRFVAVAGLISRDASNKLALVAMGLFLAGLAVKAGLVPFHFWVPDAYSSAPAPVSVFLAGIVTKVCGVYTLMRLVDSVFGYTDPVRRVLLVSGIISIVAGALIALVQKDFKRMLAYSSISQVGYIILGLGAGPGLGFAGAVFHLFNHSIFKSLLFVNAAAVERQAGTLDMDRLGGLGSRMPVTSTSSVVALLSTAGIPPLSGFWSKLLIILGVWNAGQVILASVAILASLLTLAYFLSMQRRVFFGKVAASCASVKEAGGWALLPTVLLAAITIGLGLVIPWLFNTFLIPAGSVL